MADEVTLAEFHPSPFRKRVRNNALQAKGIKFKFIYFYITEFNRLQD